MVQNLKLDKTVDEKKILELDPSFSIFIDMNKEAKVIENFKKKALIMGIDFKKYEGLDVPTLDEMMQIYDFISGNKNVESEKIMKKYFNYKNMRREELLQKVEDKFASLLVLLEVEAALTGEDYFNDMDHQNAPNEFKVLIKYFEMLGSLNVLSIQKVNAISKKSFLITKEILQIQRNIIVNLGRITNKNTVESIISLKNSLDSIKGLLNFNIVPSKVLDVVKDQLMLFESV